MKNSLLIQNRKRTLNILQNENIVNVHHQNHSQISELKVTSTLTDSNLEPPISKPIRMRKRSSAKQNFELNSSKFSRIREGECGGCLEEDQMEETEYIATTPSKIISLMIAIKKILFLRLGRLRQRISLKKYLFFKRT